MESFETTLKSVESLKTFAKKETEQQEKNSKDNSDLEHGEEEAGTVARVTSKTTSVSSNQCYLSSTSLWGQTSAEKMADWKLKNQKNSKKTSTITIQYKVRERNILGKGGREYGKAG